MHSEEANKQEVTTFLVTASLLHLSKELRNNAISHLQSHPTFCFLV